MPEITLALIAHDAKKDDMVLLVKSQYEKLKHVHIVATKSTGQFVQARTGLNVNLLEEGPRGGNLQVGGLVASNQVTAVVFLRDPLTVQSYEPSLSELLRICDVHNVPVATNSMTAKAVLNLIFQNTDSVHEESIPKQMTVAM
jgi:methylglyoxal synthase